MDFWVAPEAKSHGEGAPDGGLPDIGCVAQDGEGTARVAAEGPGERDDVDNGEEVLARSDGGRHEGVDGGVFSATIIVAGKVRNDHGGEPGEDVPVEDGVLAVADADLETAVANEVGPPGHLPDNAVVAQLRPEFLCAGNGVLEEAAGSLVKAGVG